MKKTGLYLASVVAMAAMIFFGCSEQDNPTTSPTKPTTPITPEVPEIPDASTLNIFAVDISDETDEWNYMFVGSEGASIFVDVDESTDMPTRMFLRPDRTSDEGFTIFFKENGLPDKMVVDDHILYFGNFNGYNYDLAIIYPDNTIEYHYDIETDVNWDEYIAMSGLDKMMFFGDFFKNPIIKNVVTVATPIVTCGLATKIPSTMLLKVCGTSVISLYGELARLVVDEIPNDNVSNTLSFILDATDCAMFYFGGAWEDWVDMLGGISDANTCVSVATDILSGVSNQDFNLTVERVEELAQANGMINGGRGDVKITLSWNNLADVDLHVIDPYGEEIYFANKNSRSGGALDFDNMRGYGPENIFWATGAAPSGTYEVYVKFYGSGTSGASNSSSVYTVIVHAFGNTETYTGTVSRGEGAVLVATFNSDGTITQGRSGRQVTVDMYDRYSDGWDHSGALRINVNGENITPARLSSGSRGSHNFYVEDGDLVNVYWTGNTGSYHDENAFVIYYADTPPVPTFSPTSWNGSNALLFRLQGSLSNDDLGQLLGSFTAEAGESSFGKRVNMLSSSSQTNVPKTHFGRQ